MTGRTEMVRNRVCQCRVSCLRFAPPTGQQSGVSFCRCIEEGEKAGDAANDVARSTGKGIGDMIGMMMGACKDGGVCEVEVITEVKAEEGKQARLGGGIRE